MNIRSTILLSLLTSSAEAHFRVPFPGERNATNWDTQTISPCGGDNAVVFPRYEWNPKGSPVEINYHHMYGVGAIYFCGSGNCTTGADFNELIYEPVDQTKGNFCIPAVQLPEKYNKINSTGVIQIIYGAPGKEDGDYDFMYNCIDVVVSNDGPTFDGQCSNSTEFAEADTQVAALEAKNGNEQIDKISSFSYLAKAIDSTASGASGNFSAATTTSMNMGMGGMSDMGGMTGMGDMSGMDMGTTTTDKTSTSASTDATAVSTKSFKLTTSAPASATTSASKMLTSAPGSSSTKVSTAGGNTLSSAPGFMILAMLFLI